MAEPSQIPGLAELRRQIDDVDSQLLELLNRRAGLSLAVGEAKKKVSGRVFDPAREARLLEGLAERNPGPLKPEHITAIWRAVLSASRSLQKPGAVAYLGPEGTFSYFAAMDFLGESMNFVPCRDFNEIFRGVSLGRFDAGVIPLENSIHGTITQSFDLFSQYEVNIQAEFFSRISNSLLSREESLDRVNVVYSHAQPLGQCASWLRAHLPGAKLVSVDSTAAAAWKASREEGAASIGHRNMAEKLGMTALADDIQEYLESNREVRALNRADDFLGRLNDDVDAFERAKLASELVTGTAVVCTQTLLRLGIVTTILVGTALVAAGQCSLLVFFCFMLVVTRLYDPIGLILQSVAELIDMTQSLARMKAIEGEPAQTGELTFNPQGHDIVFDDVTFAYDDGGPVLSSVSFTAREGEVTALVGPSGSGKSTAAKLAARFWDVGEGAVTVGGVDVSGIDPETLLTDYTEVFQDVVLFNGTVMENIRLGRRDATDEEVLAAARAANCDEFVQKMPQGYATPIGENGALLSGGERQRISIARAILKDAPIVLLDEATASLDVENESAVQQALSRLLVGKTVLVIAHRMRTVMGADHVVVLAEGRVAEDGTPAELLAAGGLFARMASLQGQAADWKL